MGQSVIYIFQRLAKPPALKGMDLPMTAQFIAVAGGDNELDRIRSASAIRGTEAGFVEQTCREFLDAGERDTDNPKVSEHNAGEWRRAIDAFASESPDRQI